MSDQVAAKVEITAFADGRIGISVRGQANLTGVLGMLEQAKLMFFANSANAAPPPAIEPPPSGFKYARNGS